MKLLFTALLLTSTLCYKATIKESSGKDKAIQGEFDKCIVQKGAAVASQAPKGVEVQLYKSEACQNKWFLRAWGTIEFDKAYDYSSVMLASSGENDSDADMVKVSDSGYVVTNSN
jgi:hypothetical protein